MKDDWQPIKSAPQDETKVLLWDVDEPVIGWLTTSGSYAVLCGDGCEYIEPTHWMPLPAPPSA